MLLTFTQGLFNPFTHGPIEQQPLKRAEWDGAGDPPPVPIPEGRLLEDDAAATRQLAFADPPTLELMPIEHWNGRDTNQRDVLWLGAVHDPQRDLRRPGSAILKSAGVTADTPSTQQRLGAV